MDITVKYILILCALSSYLACGSAHTETINIAVATNFIAPMKVLKADFEAETGHSLVLSFASSGKLFAQIKNGAPYDVFLSADQAKPIALEQTPFAVEGSRFTYANGILLLWSADPRRFASLGTDLGSQASVGQNKGESFNIGSSRTALNQLNTAKHIAIANPRLAPYGRAAMEVLEALLITQNVNKKLVKGESVSQAYQFVGTGNAEIGFIAASQVFEGGEVNIGSAWWVPEPLYNPILQDAILLTRAKNSEAALEFVDFLKSANVRETLKAFGYRATTD